MTDTGAFACLFYDGFQDLSIEMYLLFITDASIVLSVQVQFLTSNSNSPFQRKGAGLQKFSDLVKIVFSKDNFTLQHMEAIKKSYKVSNG